MIIYYCYVNPIHALKEDYIMYDNITTRPIKLAFIDVTDDITDTGFLTVIFDELSAFEEKGDSNEQQ